MSVVRIVCLGSILLLCLLSDRKVGGCLAFTSPTRSTPLPVLRITSTFHSTPSPTGCILYNYKQHNGNRQSSALEMTAATVAVHSGAWEGFLSIVRNFSTSSLTGSSASAVLQSITSKAVTTPPVAYFLALLSAGVGVPVSEDAICLFAGAVLPTLARQQQIKLCLALYLGIIGSDAITFWVGRALRLGVFLPLQQRLLGSSAEQPKKAEEGATAAVAAVGAQGPRRKRDRIRKVAESAGDYVGFVTRFSVGMRGPLMILTGFWKKVTFWKYFLGCALGGAFTLPLQVWLGYTLGHNNPAAILGIVAGISTFIFGSSIAVAVASSGTLIYSKMKKRKQ